jgi:hypothetical protein
MREGVKRCPLRQKIFLACHFLWKSAPDLAPLHA